MEAILGKLGLSKTEIILYLALLPIGSAPASVLAYRTGILVGTARQACLQLARKGLLRVIKKDNTLVFTPESPEKILYLLEEDRRKLAEKEESANRIIGKLKVLANPSSILPRITFAEGTDQVLQVYREFLNLVPKDSVVYNFVSPVSDRCLLFRETVIRTCVEIRCAKNIHVKCLCVRCDSAYELQKNDHCSNRETRTASAPEEHDYAFETFVWNDVVFEIVFSEYGVFSTTIRNREIAGMRNALFQLAWEAGECKQTPKRKNGCHRMKT